MSLQTTPLLPFSVYNVDPEIFRGEFNFLNFLYTVAYHFFPAIVLVCSIFSIGPLSTEADNKMTVTRQMGSSNRMGNPNIGKTQCSRLASITSHYSGKRDWMMLATIVLYSCI